MSKLPSMPMWWADFFSKTDHLSNDEQWAYAKLLAKTWLRNGRPFPDEPRDLARLLNMGVKRWLKVRERIAPFFDLSGGTWRQERLEKEFLYVTRRNAISRSNGSLGGRPKSRKISSIENPTGLFQVTQAETTHTHTQIKERDATASPKKEAGDDGRPRGSRLAPTWQPCQEDCEFAERLGLDAGVIGDQFRDYWIAKPGSGATKIDWCATWRNWCRRAAEGSKSRGNGRGDSLTIAAINRLHFPSGDA